MTTSPPDQEQVLGPPAAAKIGLRRLPHPAGTRWLDLARVLAIPAVVLIHVLVPVVLTRTTELHSPTWWTAATFSSAARWCVPVFVMVSGALLLDPDRPSSLLPFLGKRLRRVGVPLVVWSAAYLLFQRYYLPGDITIGEVRQAIYAGSPALQLYFLVIILGLYLLTPFLRVFTTYASWPKQAAFVVVFLGIGMLDQALRDLTDTGGLNAATQFLPYLGYYVGGWVLRDVAISRRLVGMAAVTFAGSVTLTTVGTGWLGEREGINAAGLYLWDYLSPPVTTMSLAAFVLIRAWGTRTRLLRDGRGAARLRRLADLTFGIYLVHMIVLLVIYQHLGVPDGVLPMLATALGVSCAVLVVSGTLTAVAQRVPVVRQVW